MSSLSDYIKSQPKRPMKEWAQEFGVSRPHLIALVNKERTPSIEVAQRIEAQTGGAVPINVWPNIQAQIAAFGFDGEGAA